MNWLKALLIFLLVMEWLNPLPYFIPFTDLTIFILLSAAFIVIDTFNFNLFLSWLFKGCLSLGLMVHLFKDELIGDREHITAYLELQFLYNLEYIQARDWFATTPFLRTLVFALLLWVILRVICTAVYRNGQGFWFGLATCIFLIILDVLTIYDVKWAFVRVVAYSLLLLSLIQLDAMEQEGRLSATSKLTESKKWVWLTYSLILTSMVIGVASITPKPNESAAFGLTPTGSTYVPKKVGYQPGDSKLGGPFDLDETIVFKAITSSQHYWRGEALSTYTGQEWQDARDYVPIASVGESLQQERLFWSLKQEDYEAKVRFETPLYNQVFAGGQILQLSQVFPGGGQVTASDNAGIRMSYANDSLLREYTVVGQNPLINETLLKESSIDYPQDIRNLYLQLPEGLPERVRLLAEELTKDARDPYQKALIIQRYLKYYGKYIYEREDIPYLEEGQDFVDQFLFVTKTGYCDYFSTSMAVLLRSVGIPARYVKGFTTGEMRLVESGGPYEATVRNENAHSWVEVYFAGYGWIPFDPTPGFTDPIKYEIESLVDRDPIKEEVEAQQEAELAEQLDRLEAMDETFNTNIVSDRGIWWLTAAAIVLVILGFYLYRNSNKLLFKILYAKVRRARHEQGVAKLYLALIKLLENMVGRRNKSETLREYIARIPLENEFKLTLQEINHWYEGYLYGRNTLHNTYWEEQQRKILHLIQRVNS
jgi:transglutaminase-like putative cysteine protease